ncbi:MAG: nuclear transport factor 2 family protein [Blastocatellia bacterium]
MTTEPSKANDEAQLRQLIADQIIAISAKDLDRIMKPYAANVVVFDVKPPLQIKGSDAFRWMWEVCLRYLPASFQTEMRELSLTISGDLALAHWLCRFTGVEKDHPASQTWMRTTAGYRRIEGRWQIVHEHVSVPFHPQTRQAAIHSRKSGKRMTATATPNDLTGPDHGQPLL